MNKTFLTRLRILELGFALLGTLLLLQVMRVQTSAATRAVGEDQANTWAVDYLNVAPQRGSIYDRFGHLLAGNTMIYEVGLELAQIADPSSIYQAMTGLLNINPGYVATALALTPGPNVVHAMMDTGFRPTQLQQLQALQDSYATANPGGLDDNLPSLEGVVYAPSLVRAYPEHSLASNVLGYYAYLQGDESAGHLGIEGYYDDLLAGREQTVALPNNPYAVTDLPNIPPGASLVLTIDRDIQAAVETILDDAVENSGSESGTIIVMDPETGEILAMAVDENERMDPNEYYNYEDLATGNLPFNRAISTTFEPGSTFKVITMAAGLDAGVITPDTTYIDTGIFYHDEAYVMNWDNIGHGPVTMTECMQYSLNVCLAWIADEQLGQDAFYQYLQAFRIGQPTNIDLEGEDFAYLLRPTDQGFSPANIIYNSFGQGIAVTPIELISAISAVANEGRIMRPHVVRAVINDGEEYLVSPQVVASPIRAETASTLTEMLAQSLEEEASSALVAGYRVAGKTGTAEIPTERGYTLAETNATFIGWGPVEDPQFIVLVWLERPSLSPWGSVVAAPVFSQVVSQLVVLMDIPPDSIRNQTPTP